jgi:hypothetical protein
LRWDWEGTIERIHHVLYVAVREQAGREASPTRAIIDRSGVAATVASPGGGAPHPRWRRPPAQQQGSTPMAHFAGLDVSVRVTSLCIVDESGRVVREARVPSEPAALVDALKGHAATLRRVGLEAGPLSQWLYGALAEAGLPAVCVGRRTAPTGT